MFSAIFWRRACKSLTPEVLFIDHSFQPPLTAAPNCEILQPGAEFLDRLLAAAFEADAHGNLMFDSQIVALCREHGIDTVLTNDRDFELFEALHVRRLD